MVREMARLQSFDDSFVFQGHETISYKSNYYGFTRQIDIASESIPPLMSREIGKKTLRKIR